MVQETHKTPLPDGGLHGISALHLPSIKKVSVWNCKGRYEDRGTLFPPSLLIRFLEGGAHCLCTGGDFIYSVL